MKLRYYQEEAIASVPAYYLAGNTGNPIISAATGSGKSLIIGALIKQIMTQYQGQRIIMATHVQELIEQNYTKLISFWPDAPAGIYSAGMSRRQSWAHIVFGGIQSMYKIAAKLGHRDILLVDECHLLGTKDMGMYMFLIAELRKINPRLIVIGFTATPWRLKGGSLLNQENAIFTDIIYDYPIAKAIEDGYLSPLISKSSVVQANTAGIKITAGEFNLKQAENALDKDELTKAALDEVERLAGDRKHFLFFASGVNHAEHVKQALRNRGWEADIITGETPKDKRAFLLNQFKNSTTKRALVNNAVLTTGTDLPNIDCICLLRATASSVLYIQMLGRGMRLHPSKSNCLVLDFAGNIERFGAVDLIQPPNPKKPSEKAGVPPQRICPMCREPVHISKPVCKCGHIFEIEEKPQHNNIASNAAIMSHEIKPVRHTLTNIMYREHMSKAGLPTVRVQYYDSYGFVTSEYVNIEHTGSAKTRALAWLKHRGIDNMSTIDDVIRGQHRIKKPVAIYTKKSGNYLEVTGYDWEV